MSSHAAPASQPVKPVMSNSTRIFPCCRSSRSNSDTKSGVICFNQLAADVNDENFSTVFFIKLNGHFGLLSGLIRFSPFPISDFRQILAVFVNVAFVLNELVLHLLFQVGALGT